MTHQIPHFSDWRCAPAGRRIGLSFGQTETRRICLGIFLKGQFEAEADGARAERSQLVGAGRDRRAEGEAIADLVGQVGDRQATAPAAGRTRRNDQPGIEIIALLLAEVRADAEAGAADVAGIGIGLERAAVDRDRDSSRSRRARRPGRYWGSASIPVSARGNSRNSAVGLGDLAVVPGDAGFQPQLGRRADAAVER